MAERVAQLRAQLSEEMGGASSDLAGPASPAQDAQAALQARLGRLQEEAAAEQKQQQEEAERQRLAARASDKASCANSNQKARFQEISVLRGI